MDGVVAPLAEALADATEFALACSGGRDSMAMLHALLQAGRRPHVLTVDHGLHPESTVTAEFVADTARGLDLDCTVLRVTVGAGEGPEDAARRARLAALEATGRCPILLAHTADDQVETLLMRLADGAGLRGLGGMAPARGVFRRPWLSVPRSAVAAYADRAGVRWREDPTNADEAFRRNRIRTALPALAALGPHWHAGFGRAAAHLQGAGALQQYLLDQWFGADLRADAQCVWFRRQRLVDAPAPVQLALAQHLLTVVEANLAPLDRRMTAAAQAIVALAHGERGGVDLPGGLRAERDPVAISIWRPGVEIVPPGRLVAHPGRYEWGVWHVEVETVASGWRLRPRRPAERFAAAGGARSIARAWVAAGVPRRLRAGLPVLADEAGALWIPGLRCARDPGGVTLSPSPTADVGARAWLGAAET